ncbi:hypothetical protein JCM5350_000736 [Sporobolomyces pararoseus]
MSSTVPSSVFAASRALYRSLLRIANKMPDDHRRALVVFRARSEFDKSRFLSSIEEIREKQTEGEIYKDQLEFQAEHLQSLAQSSNLLIPVDIRSTSVPSSSDSAQPLSSSFTQPSRPSRPTRPPRPSILSPISSPDVLPSVPSTSAPPPLDRRKLLRAFQSRKEGAVRGRSGRNRFMEGPEPSWIVKRRQKEIGKGLNGDVNETEGKKEHGDGCGCGGH